MSEEKGKKERLCIVLGYGDHYYDGVATYSSEISNAKIFRESELTDSIKNDRDNKIIFFDTKEGLEFIAEEYRNLQNFIDTYGVRVNEAKKGMEKLWNNSKKLRKYVNLCNRNYHRIIGISEDTKRRILEEVVKNED